MQQAPQKSQQPGADLLPEKRNAGSTAASRDQVCSRLGDLMTFSSLTASRTAGSRRRNDFRLLHGARLRGRTWLKDVTRHRRGSNDRPHVAHIAGVIDRRNSRLAEAFKILPGIAAFGIVVVTTRPGQQAAVQILVNALLLEAANGDDLVAQGDRLAAHRIVMDG